MTERWHHASVYGDLMRRLKDAGLSPDHADVASRLAERVYLDRRDWMIRQGRETGISIRRLAKLWGVSKSQIQRILSGCQAGCPVTSEETGHLPRAS